MKKLLIISLLSISLPALAEEPQDSSNFDPHKMMEMNFSKPDMKHRLGIDVDSFNVPPANAPSGNYDPVTPSQPEGKWVVKTFKYKLAKAPMKGRTAQNHVYCDGIFITTTSTYSAKNIYRGKICKKDRVWVNG